MSTRIGDVMVGIFASSSLNCG